MARYAEGSGNTLVTGATDATPGPGPITVRKLNGAVINWAGGEASITTIPGITVYVTEQGVEEVEPLTGSEPPNGSTVTYGTYTYTLWDGQTESATYTRTVRLTGITSLPSSGYVASGQIERFNASAAVFSGSNLTSWAGSVASTALTLVGVPTKATPVGGTSSQQVVVGASQGFTFDAAGWPVSNADRTLQMLWKPTGSGRFGGFGYGTNSAGQAFSIVVDDTNRLSVDIGGSRFYLNVTPVGQLCFVTARLADGVLTGWLGLNQVPLTDSVTGVTAMSHTVSLNTTITRGNLCRSFSNNTSPAEICVALAYGRALTDAEIVTNCLAANAEYIADTTVTAQGTPAVVAGTLTANAFSVAGTAGEVWGSVNVGAKQGTTAPTEAELASGTGLVTRATFALNNSAAWQLDATGAASGQIHRGHSWFYDMVGGKSAIATSANITTTSGDVTAPVLAFNSGFPVNGGTTVINSSIASNEGLASWTFGAFRATATEPDEAEVEAGTDGDGQPLLSLQTGSLAGAGDVVTAATNLTQGTSYKMVLRGEDAAGNVTLLISAPVSTGAAALSNDELVDGLFTRTTPVGRTSLNTLKTIGQLPAGISVGTLNGQPLLTVTADNVTLTDFDLTGYILDCNRPGFRLEQFILDPVISNTQGGGGNSPAVIKIGANATNFYAGYGRMRKTSTWTGRPESAFIQHYLGGASVAAGVRIERLDLSGFSNDGVHPGGNDFLMQWCRFDFPYQGNQVELYSGNPGDYTAGDQVAFTEGGATQWYIVRCLAAGAATLPPDKDGNADWRSTGAGPHTDLVNVRAGFGTGSAIEYCFFRDDWITPLQGGEAMFLANINNVFRLVRNTNDPVVFGPVTLRGNKSNRNNTQSSVPWFASAGANPNYNGPFHIIDNRIGPKSGGVTWTGGSAQIAAGTWSNNRNSLTGAVIPQP